MPTLPRCFYCGYSGIICGLGHSQLQARNKDFERERERLDKRVHRLVDTIANIGLSTEIEGGIRERQIRAREIEIELTRVEQGYELELLEISNAVSLSLVQAMNESQLCGGTNEGRAVLHQIFARVELGKEKLTLHYISCKVSLKLA